MLNYVKPAPPSTDKRWKLVQAEMRKFGNSHYALIQTLHAVQDAFGFLDDDALTYVATALRVPLSRVYGVATFYHYFTLKPAGRHTCTICTGTACYIKGVPDLLKAIQERFGVKLGETTEDNAISFLSARCVGACGLAPVAVIDGETVGKLTASTLISKLEEVAAK